MAVIKSKGTNDSERKTLKLPDVMQTVAGSTAFTQSLPGFPEGMRTNQSGEKASPRTEARRARMGVSPWTWQREAAWSTRSMTAWGQERIARETRPCRLRLP